MKTERTFLLDGRTYPYWRTRQNERCVEVALGIDFLQSSSHPLEIGNVLRSHQPSRRHLVIDLHEKHPGWKSYLNEDVLTWQPAAEHDRVLSISTLEHCDDPVRAIERITSWAPEILITFPLGYNCRDNMPTTELAFMQHPGLRAAYMAREPVVPTGLKNWRQVERDFLQSLDPRKLLWNQHPKPYHQSAVAICIPRHSAEIPSSSLINAE